MASHAESVKGIIGSNRRPFANIQNRYNGNNYIHRRQQEKVNIAEEEKVNIAEHLKVNNAEQEKVNIAHKENVENALYGSNSVRCFSPKKLGKEIQEELPAYRKAHINYWMNPEQLNPVYSHMKELENSLTPLSRNPNNDIHSDMRSSFIDWLVFTTERFNFDSEILHLAASYADQYIFTQPVVVDNLLLVGISAFFIACKHEECRDLMPDMNALIQHTCRTFSKRDILKMEQNLLRALNFKLFYPTAYQFLLIFCFICNCKEEEICLSLYFCDIALIYEEFSLCMKPSKIAAMCLILSIYLLNNKTDFYDIQIVSGYSQDELKCAATLLLKQFSTLDLTRHGHLIKKYSCSKFKYISSKSFNTQHFPSTNV